METQTLVLFAGASLLLNLTPGPDMLYAASRGASHGWRGAGAASLGNLAGSLVHTAFVVAGLSALLVASSSAFTAVKIAGAAYLVYLGLRVLLSESSEDRPDARPPPPLRRVARESFLIHTLNPKVAVFFLAFLPQFVTPHSPRPALELALLGGWFTVQAAVVLFLVGSIASLAGTRVRATARARRLARRGVGVVLAALGVRLAVASAR